MNNMKLADLTVSGFLDKTAGNDPVPGGGSISALNGAIAAALTEMVAGLTIGRKKYVEQEETMKGIVNSTEIYRTGFVRDIDTDSEAYEKVFNAFKLPKETDEEKTERSKKIQEATKEAAEVPLEVARKAYALMDLCEAVAEKGNQNAVTDACVAMMSARNAVLGAILNVRINLTSLKDEGYVTAVKAEVEQLEKEAVAKEQALLQKINEQLQ